MSLFDDEEGVRRASEIVASADYIMVHVRNTRPADLDETIRSIRTQAKAAQQHKGWSDALTDAVIKYLSAVVRECFTA